MPRTPARQTHCPRCGARLARDNDSGRCTPCQTAERDRITTPPVLPASFWDHEPVRQALHERHLGKVVRAYRYHPYHGRLALPQDLVARWLGITQAQLSRAENSPPMIHLDRLIHWAQLLHIPAQLLWFKLPDSIEDGQVPSSTLGHAERQPADLPAQERIPVASAGSEPEYGGDIVERRGFVITAALAGLGVAQQLSPTLSQASPPQRLGAEDVRSVMSVIDGFEQVDAAIGGNELCDFAIGLHRRVLGWERDGGYDRQVGQALQTALGELECWIGWFALDAERRPESRRYLHEAILRARLRDDARLEVRALQGMSMLIRQSHSAESRQCAEAAQRLAAGWASPRLTTLLHLRAARASAELGDAAGFNREMTKALSMFDRGEREDDPSYLRFLKQSEILAVEGYSHLALGNAGKAVDAFQADMDVSDSYYHRNRVLGAVLLAKARLYAGDVDAASQLGIETAPAVAALRSGRTTLALAGLRGELGDHAGRSRLANQFVTSYDEAARG
ncbi:hypothetical protein ACWDV4_08600 [Micromonospora sp. NPDC003197]